MTDEHRPIAEALAGSYAFERELGRGGMATVHLVHDRKHDRRVALKVLLPQFAQSLGTERFLREIRTAARLQHPRIRPGARHPRSARIHDMAREPALAVEAIKQARTYPQEEIVTPGWLSGDPAFDPIRGDPAFDALTR